MKNYITKCNLIALTLMIAFTLSSKKSMGQQELLTTQWAYNKLTVNPAYAGAKDLFSARVLHRQQWVGIDGRPVTTVLNVHSPFVRDRLALGLSYVHDKLGIMNSNVLAMSYAYRLPFEKNNSKLAFGLNFGFETLKINAGSLDLVELNDPIKNLDYSKINIKTGAGIYYYGQNFYIGVSTPNVIPNRFYRASDEVINGALSRQKTHLYIMGGYAFESANKKIIIKPQALFKTAFGQGNKVPWQMDWNLSLIFFEHLILGSTVRTTIGNKTDEGIQNLEDVASADVMLGFYATKQLLISYAYDFTLGSLKNYDKGSHEIMLGFDFNFKKMGSYTPRYF